MFPLISNIGENHYVFRASPRANTLKTSGTCLSILVWLGDNFFQIRATWQCFNVTKTCPQGGKDPLVHWYLAFACQQYHITTPFLRGVCLIVVGGVIVVVYDPAGSIIASPPSSAAAMQRLSHWWAPRPGRRHAVATELLPGAPASEAIVFMVILGHRCNIVLALKWVHG